MWKCLANRLIADERLPHKHVGWNVVHVAKFSHQCLCHEKTKESLGTQH